MYNNYLHRWNQWVHDGGGRVGETLQDVNDLDWGGICSQSGCVQDICWRWAEAEYNRCGSFDVGGYLASCPNWGEGDPQNKDEDDLVHLAECVVQTLIPAIYTQSSLSTNHTFHCPDFSLCWFRRYSQWLQLVLFLYSCITLQKVIDVIKAIFVIAGSLWSERTDLGSIIVTIIFLSGSGQSLKLKKNESVPKTLCMQSIKDA